MWRKKTLLPDNFPRETNGFFYLFLYQKNPGYGQNYDFTNWSRKNEKCILKFWPWTHGSVPTYFSREIPSGNLLHSYWKWSIEIMDLPIDSMVDFSVVLGQFTREIPYRNTKESEKMMGTWWAKYCVLTPGPIYIRGREKQQGPMCKARDHEAPNRRCWSPENATEAIDHSDGFIGIDPSIWVKYNLSLTETNILWMGQRNPNQIFH